ncbi:uncharacterized protein LOC118438224 [Folsomia candida]|uniref:uncharacterized protein LOC118438224 n=1 Tax=Folsomia candida TaxID=158441 RepID=UPI001604BC4D|nr:uncharacterized protein LOC118438224 [Folsomia candida]
MCPFDLPPTFESRDKSLRATICTKQGLGVDGAIIPVKDLSSQMGYIPFCCFNQELLNKNFLDGLSSHCWRCRQPFELLGLNLQLVSIAGRCSCSYERAGPGFAYHWPDEDFTRLIGERRVNGIHSELMISHYPVKQFYKDPSEYQNIIGPLLEEEWNHSTKNFSDTNKTRGVIIQTALVETIHEGGKKFIVTAAKISISPKHAWNKDNTSCITKCTLSWKGQEAKAKIHMMKLHTDGKLHVIVTLKTLASCRYLVNNDNVVQVIPTPNKSDYSSMKNAIDNWVSSPLDAYKLLGLLLDPGKCPSACWRFENREKPNNRLWLHETLLNLENYNRA